MEDKGRLRGLILGIESSCDETAAAVVRSGSEVLSNVVASQVALHANYGGVVPELASREHLRNIVPVIRAAMASSGAKFSDLDAIAVTEGPGLAGALLVGITYAKALALGSGKPLIAVNHLEGHIHAVLMEMRAVAGPLQSAGLEVPLLALVVSGGHTHLYLARVDAAEGDRESIIVPPCGEEASARMGAPQYAGPWRYRNVGRTVDDAAGEAFDKVAKLLGLGYPGGPWMDALASHGDPHAVEFHFGQIKPRRVVGETEGRASLDNPSWLDETEAGIGPPVPGTTFDFSFSGIKTAVLRHIQAHGMATAVEMRRIALGSALKANPRLKAAEALAMQGLFDTQTLDLISSFQHAVVGNLMRQTFAAAVAFGVHAIVVSGGVSANSELRRRFAQEAAQRGMVVAFPSVAMSTDNAAMIAAAAWPKFCAGDFAVAGLVAMPQLRLG